MNPSISHLIFAILAISAEGEGECTEKMVVLGDSYSDTGNLISLTDGGIPPPPYFSGRFSNGKVWVEYLAELMKMDTPTPFYVEKNPGTNFAIAGARSGQELSTTFFSDLINDDVTLPAKGLLAQTEDFLKGEWTSGHDSCASEYLFVIWVGTVDIFLLGKGVGTEYKTIIMNINKSIKELIARAGATKFLVLNVPQFKKTPAASGDYPSLFDTSPRGLDMNVEAFNAGLKTMLELTEKKNDVKIIQADILSLMNEIALSPLDYGLAASVAVPRLDEESFWLKEKVNYLNVRNNTLWYDGVHPTTAAHEILAQKVYELAKKSKKSKKGSKSKASTRTRRALRPKGTTNSQK